MVFKKRLMQKTRFAKATIQYNTAPVWKRFLAYLLDLILVNLIVSLPFRNYFKDFSISSLVLKSTDTGLFLVSIFVTVALILYFSILELKTGQTLGKMIFSIRAVSLLGKSMNFSQAFLRNLTKPFPIVLLVDVAYMFFRGGNQRLFEVFSRTAVVEKEMKFK